MTILSNKINKDELKPGDHIYSWRHAYIYAHHGIYVGDDKVIHFTRAAGQEIGTGTVIDNLFVGTRTVIDNLFTSSFPAKTNTPCPICGDNSNADGVILSCLNCFLSGDDLYLFQYSVNPAFFLAKARGGTCTMATSDPPAEVLSRANYLLRNGFGVYNMFKNNCEDFAMYCKTGLEVFTNVSVGRSGQCTSILAAANAVASSCTSILGAANAVASSPLRFLTTSFLTTSIPGLAVVGCGMAVVGCGIYCSSRFKSDIEIRRDVMKVPVERLVARPLLAQLKGPSEVAKIE